MPVADEKRYERDTVATLLQAAVWYVRLRRPQKVERLLSMAHGLIEQCGGLQDLGLPRVLDKYADAMRRARRPLEAGKLADLASKIRASFPDEFTPDGDDIPWWLQEKFRRAAPPLPLEYHSSHVGDVSGGEGIIAGAVAFVVAMVITTVIAERVGLSGGVAVLIWFATAAIVGTLVGRRFRRAVVRKGAESWIRVTADGVEYSEPAKQCVFRWDEIEHVWTSWEGGPSEDAPYSTVVVVGPRESFEMSSRFFTEQQVHWVNGLCKLHSGQTTFEDWRERPRR